MSDLTTGLTPLRVLGTARGRQLWLVRTGIGNYAIQEGRGGLTVCGDEANAIDHADFRMDPESPGGKRWAANHRGS